jgi:hypothetical protein
MPAPVGCTLESSRVGQPNIVDQKELAEQLLGQAKEQNVVVLDCFHKA